MKSKKNDDKVEGKKNFHNALSLSLYQSPIIIVIIIVRNKECTPNRIFLVLFELATNASLPFVFGSHYI